MSNKVKIISAFDGRCGIDNADLHISRRWPARGSSIELEKEVVEELMYDEAFRNMVEDGTLYIEDMEFKKKIGLEPEDAVTPTHVLLDSATLNRYWKVLPLSQFKVEVKKLSKAQLESLADYAIKNGEDGNIEKANYLTKVSGRNILKGIDFQSSSKEG